MVFRCLLFLSQRDVISFCLSLKRLSICVINMFLAYCEEECLLHSGTQADSPLTAFQTNIRTIYVCNKKKSCWFGVWFSCWHFRNCFRLFLIFRQTNMFVFFLVLLLTFPKGIAEDVNNFPAQACCNGILLCLWPWHKFLLTDVFAESNVIVITYVSQGECESVLAILGSINVC